MRMTQVQASRKRKNDDGNSPRKRRRSGDAMDLWACKDVSLLILTLLDRNSLFACMRVSRCWYQLAKDPLLWRWFIAREFPYIETLEDPVETCKTELQCSKSFQVNFSSFSSHQPSVCCVISFSLTALCCKFTPSSPEPQGGNIRARYAPDNLFHHHLSSVSSTSIMLV